MTSGIASERTKNTLYCSFCGKSDADVHTMISGPSVFICDECVELCAGIVEENIARHATVATPWEDPHGNG